MEDNILTLDDLKKIPEGSRWAEGLITHPGLHKNEVRWIAKKGHGHDDWCIYYHFSIHTAEFVQQHGDKVTTEGMIRQLVPCTDEVLARYRH